MSWGSSHGRTNSSVNGRTISSFLCVTSLLNLKRTPSASVCLGWAKPCSSVHNICAAACVELYLKSLNFLWWAVHKEIAALIHHKCFKFVFNRLLFKQNENLSLEFIVLCGFHYHPKFNSFLSSTIGWKPHLHKTIHLRPRRIQKKELKCRDFYISLEIGVILVVQANFNYQKQDFDLHQLSEQTQNGRSFKR